MIDLAKHPSFQSGDVHTGFIDQHFDSLFPPEAVDHSTLIQSAIALYINEVNATKKNSLSKSNTFFLEHDLRLNHDTIRTFKLKYNDKGIWLFLFFSTKQNIFQS